MLSSPTPWTAWLKRNDWRAEGLLKFVGLRPPMDMIHAVFAEGERIKNELLYEPLAQREQKVLAHQHGLTLEKWVQLRSLQEEAVRSRSRGIKRLQRPSAVAHEP